MGIAKKIEAYTTCTYYHENPNVFIKNISEKLDADFIVNSLDVNYDFLHEENKLTTFNKTNKYKLLVEFYEYKINNKIVELPLYEIKLPINYIDEDYLNIVFYPSYAVQISFLTFDHLWETFIESLKYQSIYEERNEAVKRYQSLRKEYIPILKKLEIDKICIITNAYYNVEGICNFEYLQKAVFSDIIKIAIEKDKLSPFDFQEILNANEVGMLSKSFLEKQDLQIMLIDSLYQL